MGYRKPGDVDSPKSHWLQHRALHDGGEFDWAAAEGQWKGENGWEDCLAIRWNGGNGTGEEIGKPAIARVLDLVSSYLPILEDAIRAVIKKDPSESEKVEPVRGPRIDDLPWTKG